MTATKIKTTKNYTSKKSPPKRISQTYLHNSGLYYLQRFSSSVENFRRVFKRKIINSCRHHIDQDLESCFELLEKIIENFKRVDLLNDETYAQGKINSLRRSGQSTKSVIQKMQVKGINQEMTQEMLRKFEDRDENSELNAALIFARKKRIGPYTNFEKEFDYTKQLAAMARAGFSYEISAKIIKMTQDDL